MITEELKKLYIAHTGHEPEQIDELPSSGSNRRYFRLIGSPTLIGVSGESVEENRAFLYMAEHFRQKGLPVPQVFIRSEDDIYYLQEDLGDSLLFNAIEKGRKTSVFGEEEKQLLRKTIRLLPAVQFAGADGMDFSYCYPQAEFNSRSILWDLNYFKYCFLKATGMDFQEDRLEDDFQKMADVLLRSSSATFMYRDFQSRNVMIKDGEPGLIDFQAGVALRRWFPRCVARLLKLADLSSVYKHYYRFYYDGRGGFADGAGGFPPSRARLFLAHLRLRRLWVLKGYALFARRQPKDYERALAARVAEGGR